MSNYNSRFSGNTVDSSVDYYLNHTEIEGNHSYSYITSVFCEGTEVPSAPFDNTSLPVTMPSTFPFAGIGGNLWYEVPMNSTSTWYQCFLKINKATNKVEVQGAPLSIKGDRGDLGEPGGQVIENRYFVLIDENGEAVEDVNQAIAIKPFRGLGFSSDSFSSAFGMNTSGGGSGGGGGANFDIFTAWGGEYTDDFVLSAALGVNLNNRLSAIEGNTSISTGDKANWNAMYSWYQSVSGENTDGLINKWNEIVAFLASYSESDSLAALLALKLNTADVWPWVIKPTQITFADIAGIISFNQLPTLYWANVPISNASSINTNPTVASIKIGEATLSWDSVNQCLLSDKGFASLSFSSAFGANSSGSASITLGDLTNVAINSPVKEQVLVYNGSSWVNKTIETGGGNANIGFNQAGTGNAVTNVSYTNGTLTATKGATFMQTSHAANSVTTAKISNWDSAFSWGNHASAGYRAGAAPTSGNWFNGTPMVGSDGVMEVGRYIDFHPTGASTLDYGCRIDAGTSTSAHVLTLPNKTDTLATLGDIPKGISGTLSVADGTVLTWTDGILTAKT